MTSLPAICSDCLLQGSFFLNPQYYANHPKLTEAKTFSSFSDTTLFSLLQSDSGQKEFAKEGSRKHGIQGEAMAACKLGKCWTFLDVMAVATVLKRPLFSLYTIFESNGGIRPLLNGLLQPLAWYSSSTILKVGAKTAGAKTAGKTDFVSGSKT